MLDSSQKLRKSCTTLDPSGLHECGEITADVPDFFLVSPKRGIECNIFLTDVTSSLAGTSKFMFKSRVDLVCKHATFLHHVPFSRPHAKGFPKVVEFLPPKPLGTVKVSDGAVKTGLTTSVPRVSQFFFSHPKILYLHSTLNVWVLHLTVE